MASKNVFDVINRYRGVNNQIPTEVYEESERKRKEEEKEQYTNIKIDPNSHGAKILNTNIADIQKEAQGAKAKEQEKNKPSLLVRTQSVNDKGEKVTNLLFPVFTQDGEVLGYASPAGKYAVESGKREEHSSSSILENSTLDKYEQYRNNVLNNMEELTSSDGKLTFGKITPGGYKAITNNKLDTYKPFNVEEETTINSFLEYLKSEYKKQNEYKPNKYSMTKSEYNRRRAANSSMPEFGSYEYFVEREKTVGKQLENIIESTKTPANNHRYAGSSLYKKKTNVDKEYADAIAADYANILSNIKSMTSGVNLTADGKIDYAGGVKESADLESKYTKLKTYYDWAAADNLNKQRGYRLYEYGKKAGDASDQRKLATDKREAYEYAEKYQDSVYNTGFTGKVAGNYRLGDINERIGQTGYTSLAAYTDDIEAAQIYKMLYDNITNNNIKTFTNTSGFQDTYTQIAQYVPQFLNQTKAQMGGYLVGGLLGYATGSPGTGARFGGAAASALYMYNQTAGQQFVKYLTESGLTKEDAKVLATNTAIASAAVEFGLEFALDKLWAGGSKLIKIGGKSASKAIEETSEKLIKTLVNKGMSQKGAKIAVNVATNAGKFALNSLGEGSEEWIQMGMEITADKAAKKGESLSLLQILGRATDLSQYTEEDFKKMNDSFKAGATIGLASGGFTSVTYGTLERISNTINDTSLGGKIKKLDNNAEIITNAINYASTSDDKNIQKLGLELAVQVSTGVENASDNSLGKVVKDAISNKVNPFNSNQYIDTTTEDTNSNVVWQGIKDAAGEIKNAIQSRTAKKMSVDVGDAFKDTNTGNTIRVVQRDSSKTVVEIDTGAKTEQKTVSNHRADTLASNRQYERIGRVAVPVMEKDLSDEDIFSLQNQYEQDKLLFELLSEERKNYLINKRTQHKNTIDNLAVGDVLYDQNGREIAEVRAVDSGRVFIVGGNFSEYISPAHFSDNSRVLSLLEAGAVFQTPDRFVGSAENNQVNTENVVTITDGTEESIYDKMEKLGLTYDEQNAIMSYKSSGSYTLNEALRVGGVQTNEQLRLKSDLNSALGKFPIYRGIVYRNIGFTTKRGFEKFIEEHSGKEVTYPAFTSSSKSIDGYIVEDMPYLVHYEIESISGRDVSEIGITAEKEVLFVTDTLFEISSISQNGNSLNITMKEGKQNGKDKLKRALENGRERQPFGKSGSENEYKRLDQEIHSTSNAVRGGSTAHDKIHSGTSNSNSERVVGRSGTQNMGGYSKARNDSGREGSLQRVAQIKTPENVTEPTESQDNKELKKLGSKVGSQLADNKGVDPLLAGKLVSKYYEFVSEQAKEGVTEAIVGENASEGIKSTDEMITNKGVTPAERADVANIAKSIELTLEGTERSIKDVANAVDRITTNASSFVDDGQSYGRLFGINLEAITRASDNVATEEFIRTYAEEFADNIKAENSELYEKLVMEDKSPAEVLTQTIINKKVPAEHSNKQELNIAAVNLSRIVRGAAMQIGNAHKKIYGTSEAINIPAVADSALKNNAAGDIINYGGETYGREETVYMQSAQDEQVGRTLFNGYGKEEVGGITNPNWRNMGQNSRNDKNTGRQRNIYGAYDTVTVGESNGTVRRGDKTHGGHTLICDEILPQNYTADMASVAAENKKFGFNTVFSDGELVRIDDDGKILHSSKDGCYNQANRIIYINARAQYSIFDIAQHERVHGLKKMFPLEYEQLHADILEHVYIVLFNQEMMDYIGITENAYGISYNTDIAIEEILANLSYEIYSNKIPEYVSDVEGVKRAYENFWDKARTEKALSSNIPAIADSALKNNAAGDIINYGGETYGREETVYMRSAQGGQSIFNRGRTTETDETGKRIPAAPEERRNEVKQYAGVKGTTVEFTRTEKANDNKEAQITTRNNKNFGFNTVFFVGQVKLYDKAGNLIQVIEEGCYNQVNKTIYINYNTTEAFENISAHERVHGIKREHPNLYDGLLKTISSYIDPRLFSAEIKSYFGPYERAYQRNVRIPGIIEEILANLSYEIYSDKIPEYVSDVEGVKQAYENFWSKVRIEKVPSSEIVMTEELKARLLEAINETINTENEAYESGENYTESLAEVIVKVYNDHGTIVGLFGDEFIDNGLAIEEILYEERSKLNVNNEGLSGRSNILGRNGGRQNSINVREYDEREENRSRNRSTGEESYRTNEEIQRFASPTQIRTAQGVVSFDALPQSWVDTNAEAQTLAESNARKGLNTVFFVGPAQIGEGESAKGFIYKSTVYVSVNHSTYTAEQISRHEITHHYATSSAYSDLVGSVVNGMTEAERQNTYNAMLSRYEKVANAYIQAQRDRGKIISDAQAEAMLQAYIYQEMMCDLVGGIDEMSAYTERFADAVANFEKAIESSPKVSEYQTSTESKANAAPSTYAEQIDSGTLKFSQEVATQNNTGIQSVVSNALDEISIEKPSFYNFPPDTPSQTDAHHIATRWAHQDEVENQSQTLIFYRNKCYLIEKFDSLDFKYQIVGTIKYSEYQQAVKELRENVGHKGQRTENLADKYDKRYRRGNRHEGRGQGSNADAIEYKRQDRYLQRLDKNQNNKRGINSNPDRSNEQNSRDRQVESGIEIPDNPNIRFSVGDAKMINDKTINRIADRYGVEYDEDALGDVRFSVGLQEDTEFNNLIKEIKPIKIKMKQFGSDQRVWSEAHRIATQWAYNEDVKVRDQALVFFHDAAYIIEKYDAVDFKYVIEGKLRANDVRRAIEEVKRRGEIIQRMGIITKDRTGRLTVMYEERNKSDIRTDSLGTDATKNSGTDVQIRQVGDNADKRRKVDSNSKRSNAPNGNDRQIKGNGDGGDLRASIDSKAENDISFSADRDVNLTGNEWSQFYNSLDALERGNWFPQTLSGDYIFETDNKLLFNDGDYQSPTINAVMTFENMTDEEIEFIKEVVWNDSKRTQSGKEYCETIRHVLQYGDVTFTDYENNRTYRVRKDDSREGTGGGGNTVEVGDARVTDTADEIRFSRDGVPLMPLDYQSLISKKDMPITKVYDERAYTRQEVRILAKENARAKGNANNTDNTSFVKNRDTGVDIIVGRQGINHGLVRKYEDNAVVGSKIGDYLENAIYINELLPRNESDVATYVLLGYGESIKAAYPAYFIINIRRDGYHELEEYGVLSSSNAKKIEGNLASRATTDDGTKAGSVSIPSTISIADLLDLVKNDFSAILPKSVLNHYGIQRAENELTNGIRFSVDGAKVDLTEDEWGQFYSSLYELERGKWFPQTLSGDYIFETDNKLVFNDGDYPSPTINAVMTFEDMTDDEIEISKESVWIYANKTENKNELWEVVKQMLPDGDVTLTDIENNRTYQVRKDGSREGTGGSGNTVEVGNSRVDDDADVRFSRDDLTPEQQEIYDRIMKRVEKYGAHPKGVQPRAREVEVPRMINDTEAVSRHARTLMEAEVTPDEAMSEFGKAILEGKMGGEIITDKKAANAAEDIIDKKGYEKALEDWVAVEESGEKVSKEHFVLGQVLYNQAMKNKDIKTGMKLATHLVLSSRNAGQVVQAASMIKKMTPEGQMYYIQKTAEKFDREAHKDYSPMEQSSLVKLLNDLLHAETDEERTRAKKKLEMYIIRKMSTSPKMLEKLRDAKEKYKLTDDQIEEIASLREQIKTAKRDKAQLERLRKEMKKYKLTEAQVNELAYLRDEIKRAKAVEKAIAKLNKAIEKFKSVPSEKQEDFIKTFARELRALQHENLGIKVDEKLVQQFLDAKTQEERDAVYDKICANIAEQMPASFREKWDNWRYLAMLGNPRTHIRNVLGNAGFWSAVKIKNGLNFVLEKIFIDEKDRTRAIKKTKESKDFALKDFEKVKKMLQGQNDKYAITDDVGSKRKIWDGKLTKYIDTIRKKNFDLLELEDMVFLKNHYTNALASIITARKLDVNNIDAETLDKLRAYAIKEAKAATFRDDNAIAEIFSKWQRDLDHGKTAGKIAGFLFEGAMPFKKTPLNIAKQGLIYSPLGVINGLTFQMVKLKKEQISATEVIDTISKGLTGTGVMLLGIFLTSLGWLVGPEDENAKKRKFDKMVGEQSYALKIGDITYTIDWMSPVALPLFVGNEIYNRFQRGEERTLADIVEAISNISEPMLELSVLSGISDTISSAKYSNSNSIKSLIETSILNYATQALPTIGGQIARITDPTKYNYYYKDKTSPLFESVQAALGQMASKIPGMGKLLFTPSVDMWGREETYGNLFERVVENLVSPGYYAEENYTSVDRVLQNLYERTGDPAVFPPTQQKKYVQDGEIYDMSAARYTEVVKMRGKISYNELRELIVTSKFIGASDEEKVALIEKVYRKAGEETKAVMIEKMK